MATAVTKGYQVPKEALVGFEEFWAAHPRKTKKGDAKLAWYQVRAAERGLLPLMLTALAWQKRTEQWTKAGSDGKPGAFIPYPATWLRAEQWEDEPTEALEDAGSDRIAQERARTEALLRQRQEAIGG